MRIEPARQSCGNACENEHCELRTSGVDTEGFSRCRPATQGTNSSSDTRVQQVSSAKGQKQNERPDHVVHGRGVKEAMPRDFERRNTGDAIVPAEEIELAEEIIECDAPGDRAERQIVTGQA